MSSTRGLLIRLTARRIFYTGPGKEAASACNAVKSTAIAPNPPEQVSLVILPASSLRARCLVLSRAWWRTQVPQRASSNGDVGPLMRAAKLHIMRTGRFPSFAELKAELCKATAAGGGSGQGHNAALLRVRDMALQHAVHFYRVARAPNAMSLCQKGGNLLIYI